MTVSVSDKDYLKSRVNEEFNPLLRRLRDLLIPVREKIRSEVFKSLGVDKVEAKIERLKEQLGDLERQYRTVMGEKTSFGGEEPKNTPFAREVETRLMLRPEAKALQSLQEKFKETKDEVVLVGAPVELRNLLKSLPKAVEKFQAEVLKLESRN